jgi:DNA-binding PadR family transcriptional regulator
VEPRIAGAPPVPTGSLTGDLAAARGRSVADRLAPGGRRTRKAYRITERGEALLVELLLADDDRTDDDKVFLAKLAFCGHLEPAARLAMLRRRRDALQARLDRSSTTRGARAPRNPDRYLSSLVEHRTRSTQRDLEWIDELIAAETGPAPEIEIVPEPPVQEGATA